MGSRTTIGRLGASVLASAVLLAAAACTSNETGSGTSTTTPAGTSAPPVGGSAPPSTAPATRAPTTTAGPNEHQWDLDEGETATLVAELVAVPGYRYSDISAGERDQTLMALPADVSAATFHGVVDKALDEEIAYLILTVPAPDDAIHAPANARQFGEWALGTDEVTSIDMSGQQVWFSEDASRPLSRYKYAWLRHGTLGWLDGSDREQVEGFLQAYFAVPFAGAEDPVLSERMADVPGYTFTNTVRRRKEQDAAEGVFPGATASLHYIFDETHSFGGLVLVGPVSGVTDDELVDKVAEWMAEANGLDAPPTLAVASERTTGGVTVRQATEPTSGLAVFVWQWPDTEVVGWVVTSRPDIAEDFVPAFLAAQPVTG